MEESEVVHNYSWKNTHMFFLTCGQCRLHRLSENSTAEKYPNKIDRFWKYTSRIAQWKKNFNKLSTHWVKYID